MMIMIKHTKFYPNLKKNCKQTISSSKKNKNMLEKTDFEQDCWSTTAIGIYKMYTMIV